MKWHAFKGKTIGSTTRVLNRNVQNLSVDITHCLTINAKLLLLWAVELSLVATSLPAVFLGGLMCPYQYSINCTGTALETSLWHFEKAFRDGPLRIMIFRICYDKVGMLFIASTTYQKLLNVSVWPIPNVVIMSYGEPPANHRMAHARRTSGEIRPFGTHLDWPPSFWPDTSSILCRRSLARRLKVVYFILYALLKYTSPSCR